MTNKIAPPAPVLNLYQRINEIRKAVSYIQKDKMVSTGTGKPGYKAVTHDAVTAVIRDHLVNYGIVCIPTLIASHLEPPRNAETAQQRYVATYAFDFVNIDKPDEHFPIVIEAHAMDSGDKAPGKALSYANKYAFLKLFNLESGDDEESRYGEQEPPDSTGKKAQSTVEQPRARSEKKPETAAPVEQAGSPPAEEGEIMFIRNKVKNLKETPVGELLSAAGCLNVNPNFDKLTKAEFAALKIALKGCR